MSTPIKTVLLTKDQLRSKATQVNGKPTPSAPSALREKHANIWIIIKNKTQFDISYLPQETWFDYGRFYEGTPAIGAFDITGFGVCNKNLTLTGVGGGIPYGLALDQSNKFNFAIGFTDPNAGTYKASVVESTKGKDAWEKANENGSLLQSNSIYSGVNEDGEKVLFRFELNATPGNTMTVNISQVFIEQ
ncbi:hypothetical protein PVAG01_06227 [Phlyctema vagabunda]|uniref:Uncharacterized protein n=1 Tax=Phlyctema vagabunda TaxID=108571 RepID=A0ABR4PFF8_9HELO